MRAKKIYIQNGTSSNLYVQAYAEGGRFLIIVTRRLPLSRAESVPPDKSASYPVNDAVRACFSPAGKLLYELRNQTGEPMQLSAEMNHGLQGLVLTVSTKGN